MKVLIWVHKSDVVNNNITKYYLNRQPQSSNWTDYVQVEVTQDEFVQLEDKNNEVPIHLRDSIQEIKSTAKRDDEAWLVNQFNRNRNYTEMIDRSDEIDNDQDNQPFAD